MPSASRSAARGGVTVAALCRDYLAAAEKGLVLGKRKRAKSDLTLATDKGRIERHIVPLLGRKPVADVQAADVRRFLHAVQTGKTAKTIRTGWRGVARVTGGRGTAARTVGLLGTLFRNATTNAFRQVCLPKTRSGSIDDEVRRGPAELSLPKRMARPVGKQFQRFGSWQSASTYPACGRSPGQDGVSRVLVLITLSARDRHFRYQVARTPVRLSGHLVSTTHRPRQPLRRSARPANLNQIALTAAGL
jgi:hypothetical protein